tara:strand:+ start:281 stop:457 length:177 start_codon:yes stop_codon:yes gene_type:complete
MKGDYLEAYQSFSGDLEKITYTKIDKVSYLVKLKAQQNSISDLDIKHKAWAQKELISN